MKRIQRPGVVFGIFGFIIAAVSVIGWYLLFSPKTLPAKAPDQVEQKKAADEAQKILEDLGRFMILPEERPTIAYISDVTKLKDQAFFAQAQNGDILFVFRLAKRAILYRPSTEKIVDFSSINLPSPSSSP